MVMPAKAYKDARRAARYHLQVELAPVEVGKTPAHVSVTARVIRIFRGDHALAEGDNVYFSVPVCRAGDPIPCGGDLWIDVGNFQAAKYLEVFLNGDPPQCELAASQCWVIHAPSKTPCM